MKFHLLADSDGEKKTTACGLKVGKYHNHTIEFGRFDGVLSMYPVGDICDECKEVYYDVLQATDGV